MKIQKLLISFAFFFIWNCFQTSGQSNYEWGIILSDEYTQRVTSIGLDSNDNVYISGLYLYDIDLDPGSGVTDLNTDFLNAFLAKYSKGGILLWAIKLDMGTDDMSPNELPDLDVDEAGNCYVVGQQEYFNSNNIYFAKYSTSGVKLWDYEVQGNENGIGWTISALSDGSCIVAGAFAGTKDFAPGQEVFELTSDGTSDLFLAKYHPTGALNWAKNFGGSSNSNATIYDINIDLEESIYIVGARNMTFDFDPISSSSNSILSASNSSGYVAKYDSFGNFQWVEHWGDNGGSGIPHEIAIDKNNNFIVTGIYRDLIDFNFTQDSSLVYNSGFHNIFVAKYSSEGELFWGIPLVSSSTNSGKSIDVDSMNNIHVTGFFGGVEGIDLDPSTNDAILPNVGVYDMFYSIYDEDGNYKNGFSIGGVESVEVGIGIKIDSENNAIIAGWYSSDSIDFDITNGIDIHSSIGTDVFVIKYSQDEISTNSIEIVEGQIKIFPNPVFVNQVINLNIPYLENYKIKIADMKGVILGTYLNTNKTPSPQNAGLYNLIISKKGFPTRTIKFVVVE